MSAAVIDAATSVVVSEVFGPTFQGEGPNLGRRAAFVRLGGCNLHCSWCDTPYTWDARRFDLRAELQRRPVGEIVTQVEAMNPNIIVVTGGEPLLWQARPGWPVMLSQLAGIAPVEVETNGTIAPTGSASIARFNVSPKLAHAGDPRARRIVPPALRAFAALAGQDRAVMKVVVRNREHVRQAARLADSVGFPRSAVWVMPEGTTPTALTRRTQRIADAALNEGLSMTTRLHVLAWGQDRGR